MASIMFSYSIEFGKNIRIGYKPKASSDQFTYINAYPSYAESPYTIPGLTPGLYDIEITTICSNCSGNQYSDPYIFEATAT